MDLSNQLKKMFQALDGLKDIVDTQMAEDRRTPFYDPVAGLAMYTGIMASMLGYDLCESQPFEVTVSPVEGLDLSEPLKRAYAYHTSLLGIVEAFPVEELKSRMLDHTSAYLLHLDEVAEAFDYNDEEEGEDIPNTLMTGCSTVLHDAGGPEHRGELRVTVNAFPNGVLLLADGYGDKTSEPPHGSPVVIELYEGVLRVLVFGDINQEDPTHIIPLDGAMESKRKE